MSWPEISVDEKATALRYLAQVRSDSSLAYASKHAHDHMMHIALAAEVARLRGLIKAAEFDAMTTFMNEAESSVCPWCGIEEPTAKFVAELDAQHRNRARPNGDAPEAMPVGKWPHKVDCPAFTPDGEVR